MNWTAIGVTVKLATLTALILVTVGLPIAYWLSFSRRRWKFLIESVVALPLVLPPTVLGFYILVAIGPHSPLGRFYTSLVGHPLPFTFEGLLVASVLYSLPLPLRAKTPGYFTTSTSVALTATVTRSFTFSPILLTEPIVMVATTSMPPTLTVTSPITSPFLIFVTVP